MRRALLPLLLVGGCLHYEISVETAVAADGATRREIRIRETSEEPKTWKNLVPPGPPYVLEGDEATGFVAKASQKPGTHGSGLHYRTGKEEEGGAHVSGSVTVEVTDLRVGKLYVYRERFPTAIDPERFRRELPLWMERSLAVGVEAMRLMHPDIDWAPVEAHVRGTVLPQLEKSMLAIHSALQVLIADGRAHHYGNDFEAWRSHPQARVLLAEMERYGLRRKAEAKAPRTVREFFDEASWEHPLALLDLFFRPLKAELRALVDKSILEPSEGAPDRFEEVMDKLYPEGEVRDKLERDGLAWLISLLGAPAVIGIVDQHDLRFGVLLPGQLLATNGEPSGDLGVRWQLDNADLFLVGPELSAVSFLPAEGEPQGRWRLRSLLAIRDALLDGDEEPDLLKAIERARAEASG